jgi:hypothetical protein
MYISSETPQKKRDIQSEQIRIDTEEFIKAGGIISIHKQGETGDKLMKKAEFIEYGKRGARASKIAKGI